MQLMGVNDKMVVDGLIHGSVINQKKAGCLLRSGLLTDLLTSQVDWCKVDREQFRRLLGLPPLWPQYQVVVVGTRLCDMIRRGKYGWVHPAVSSAHFSIHPAEQWEVVITLMTFNQNTMGETARTEIIERGYRPATLPELLALGELYPDLQWSFPIVALASRWRHPDGLDCVPVLNRHQGKRALSLSWYADFGHICRFAVVRDEESSVSAAA